MVSNVRGMAGWLVEELLFSESSRGELDKLTWDRGSPHGKLRLSAVTIGILGILKGLGVLGGQSCSLLFVVTRQRLPTPSRTIALNPTWRTTHLTLLA